MNGLVEQSGPVTTVIINRPERRNAINEQTAAELTGCGARFEEVGRDLARMVNYSTTAEYVMSIDTVDLSGVKRVSLPAADQAKALENCKVVEEEWLKKTGADGQELLGAIKAAVEKYRGFSCQ